MKTALDKLNTFALLSAVQTLDREYKFKDFKQAMGFVNNVAKLAESCDHHPDILVRYNRVTLSFYTHTSNSVTEKDVRLAAATDDLFNNSTKELT